MTGLLHRLAARAHGSAWSVQSDARLPFAAEGLEAAPAQAAQAPQGAPLPLLQPAAPALTPAQPAQAAVPPTAMPMPPARLQQAPWQAPARAPSAATGPQVALPPHSPEPLVHEAPPPPLFATQAQPELARPRISPVAATAHTVAAPALAPSQPPRDPAPLLPAHAGAAPSAIPAGPAPSARAAASRAGNGPPTTHEDTEVHIHIGRIDISAVHETPKPKPRTRERAQPVSLHDYLATRTRT